MELINAAIGEGKYYSMLFGSKRNLGHSSLSIEREREISSAEFESLGLINISPLRSIS